MPTAAELAKHIPALIAGTETQSSIARKLGVHPSNVCRQLQQDGIQELIKAAQVKLVKGSLDKAIQNQQDKIDLSSAIIAQVRNGQETHPLAKTMAELGDRAEQGLMQSTGIAVAHTQSIQINNLLISNTVNLSPAIEAMLTERLGQVSDAEYDDDDLDG
jgi:ribosomal protein S13